eukprot:362156-Chlamydomonas_euryale.AAC.25
MGPDSDRERGVGLAASIDGAHSAIDGGTCKRARVGVGVTGSGRTQSMPVLSGARHRGSSCGLGTVTKGTPLRTGITKPILANATRHRHEHHKCAQQHGKAKTHNAHGISTPALPPLTKLTYLKPVLLIMKDDPTFVDSRILSGRYQHSLCMSAMVLTGRGGSGALCHAVAGSLRMPTHETLAWSACVDAHCESVATK